MKTEHQPFGTFNVMNVQPGPTNLKLSGGETIPYIYQLAINSTVPFIQLIGSGGMQKLLSWNEKILVPPGEMVTVKNASFHPGDIWISSGWDPGVRPSRVTVPVGLEVIAGDRFRPKFKLDTRRARRAFIVGLANGDEPYKVTVKGVARLRSHAIVGAFADTATPVPQYTDTFAIPAFTDPGLIALGEQATPADPVHMLLDLTSVEFERLGGMTNASGALRYVLEYN